MSSHAEQPGATIRRARLGDFSRVYRTVRASFAGEHVDPLDVLLALCLPWVSVLLAEVGREPVGTTFVIPGVFSPVTWIATVGVTPPYRRQGIARALLVAAERATRQARLRLEVYADNFGAIALYESLGYHPLRHYRDAWDRRERIEMEKVR